MSDEKSKCPTCAGLGKVYCQVNEDHRMELKCPDCGGTGRQADALYRVLTGEADDAYQTNRESIRLIRVTHGGAWTHTRD